MVVDRINRAILAFIRKRSAVRSGRLVADASELRLTNGERVEWSIPWPAVQRVTALQYPGFVGDTITLAIEAGQETQLVNEEQEGWSELVSALSSHLPGAQRYEEWTLALVSGGADAKIVVFDRDA